MHLNPADVQTIGTGLAAFLAALVFVFVFLSARKEPLGRAVTILYGVAVIWSWFGFLYEIVPNLVLARDLRIISLMGAVWIVMAFVNFSVVYLKERAPVGAWGRGTRLFSLIGGTLISLFLVNDIFGGKIIVAGLTGPATQVLAPSAGPFFFVLFVFHILCIALSAVLFLRRVHASVDISDRRQAEMIWVSLTTALTLGDARLISWYGVNTQFLALTEAIAAPIFVFATFYAIKRYKLLNVRVITAQIIIFALWSFTFFRLLFDKTVATIVPDAILFLAVLILGIYLLRSVIKEIRAQKELALLTVERTKSEFVAIAAHQLRTPLTAIRWVFNSLSAKDREEVFSKDQRRTIELGKGAADNMALVVNDLLNAARVSRGSFELNVEPGDVRDAVRAATNLFEEAAKDKRLQLTVDIPESALHAIFDRGNLALALENLIDNAIKYTHEGGTVSVRASREGEKILIHITDTGIGISPSDQARLFEKFFRGKPATLMFTDGSGLGLFIAKSIVEGLGGTISLSSSEGKGTDVAVVLPATPPTPAANK